VKREKSEVVERSQSGPKELESPATAVSISASAVTSDSKGSDDQNDLRTPLTVQNPDSDLGNTAKATPVPSTDPQTVPAVSPSRIREPLPLASTYNQFPSTGPPKPSKQRTAKASTAVSTVLGTAVNAAAAPAAAVIAAAVSFAADPPALSQVDISPAASLDSDADTDAAAVPQINTAAVTSAAPVDINRLSTAPAQGSSGKAEAVVTDAVPAAAAEPLQRQGGGGEVKAAGESLKDDEIRGKDRGLVDSSAETTSDVKSRREAEGIDWEKMKSRGSDLYYRAQGGVEGGRDFRNDFSARGTGAGRGAARVVGKKNSYAAYIPPLRAPVAPQVPLSTPPVAVTATATASAGVPLDQGMGLGMGLGAILEGTTTTTTTTAAAAVPVTIPHSSPPTAVSSVITDSDDMTSKAVTENTPETENIDLSSKSEVLTERERERERVQETALPDDQHSGPANTSASAPSPPPLTASESTPTSGTGSSAVTSTSISSQAQAMTQSQTYKARSVRSAYVMAAPQVTETSSWVPKGVRRLVSSSPSAPVSVSAALLSSATRTVSKVPILPSLAAPAPVLLKQAQAPAYSAGPASPLYSPPAGASPAPPATTQQPAASASTSVSVTSLKGVESSSEQLAALMREGEGMAASTSTSQRGRSELSVASSEQKTPSAPALSSLSDDSLSSPTSPPPTSSTSPPSSGSLVAPSNDATSSVTSTSALPPTVTGTAAETSTERSEASGAPQTRALSLPLVPTPVSPPPPQSVAASLSIAESLRNAILQEGTEVRARTLLTTVTDIIFGPAGTTPKAGVKSPPIEIPMRAEGGAEANAEEEEEGEGEGEGEAVSSKVVKEAVEEEDPQRSSTSASAAPPLGPSKGEGEAVRISDVIDGYSPATAGSTAKRTWQTRVPREFKTTASLLSAASPSPKLSPTLSQLTKKRAQSPFVPPPSALIKPTPLTAKAPPVYAYPTQLEEAETVRRTYGLVVGTDEELLTGKSAEKVVESIAVKSSSGNIVGSSADPAGKMSVGGPDGKGGQDTMSEEEQQEARRARREAEARARTEWVETVMARAKDMEIRARRQKKATDKRVTSSSSSSSPSKPFKEKNSPWPF
jgi:hypothetical protein